MSHNKYSQPEKKEAYKNGKLPRTRVRMPGLIAGGIELKCWNWGVATTVVAVVVVEIQRKCVEDCEMCYPGRVLIVLDGDGAGAVGLYGTSTIYQNKVAANVAGGIIVKGNNRAVAVVAWFGRCNEGKLIWYDMCSHLGTCEALETFATISNRAIRKHLDGSERMYLVVT
eukprot:15367044-Ditylum_brightwellii.AAC.3